MLRTIEIFWFQDEGKVITEDFNFGQFLQSTWVWRSVVPHQGWEPHKGNQVDEGGQQILFYTVGCRMEGHAIRFVLRYFVKDVSLTLLKFIWRIYPHGLNSIRLPYFLVSNCALFSTCRLKNAHIMSQYWNIINITKHKQCSKSSSYAV